MYHHVKRLLKTIIPKKVLFRIEPVVRSLYYLFYRGKDYQCNVCGKELRQYIHTQDNEKMCPNCGSISRNRRLWELLDSTYLKENVSVLDFSPSRCLFRKLKGDVRIQYTGTDLSDDFLSDKAFDITAMDVPGGTYDIVICYHILEHVDNDLLAMKELHRVLKNKGTCIVQTPFKHGGIYEDESVQSAEDRLKHFGQEDHVRIYSVPGLKERLEKAGFHVSVNDYIEEPENKFGFKTKETVLFCKK
jgi:SAM-dependent methyltransferase